MMLTNYFFHTLLKIIWTSKNNTNGRNQFAMLTIDDLVPQDHLVRKIDAALDFEFIYPIVEATYSDLGRPSIDPVILIKLSKEWPLSKAIASTIWRITTPLSTAAIYSFATLSIDSKSKSAWSKTINLLLNF
ncbi:hypothetical protein EfmJHP35_28630 [Enterococcus faecium]|nr:hypothetical protein EfmJHP35_28630 [Enterococcus faecium]